MSNEADTAKIFRNISKESKESFSTNEEVLKHSQQEEIKTEEPSKSKITSLDEYLAEKTDFSEDEFGSYTSEEDFRAYTSEEDNDSENNLDTKSQRAFSFLSYFQKPASEVSSNSNILESKSNPQKTTVTKKRKRKRKILQKIDGHMSGFGDCQSKNYYESLTDEDLKCPICLDLIEGDFVYFLKEAKKFALN